MPAMAPPDRPVEAALAGRAGGDVVGWRRGEGGREEKQKVREGGMDGDGEGRLSLSPSLSLSPLSLSTPHRHRQRPAGPIIPHREHPARHGRQGGLQPARRRHAVRGEREFDLGLHHHAHAPVRQDDAVHAHVQGRDRHAGDDVGNVGGHPEIGGGGKAREFDAENDGRVGAVVAKRGRGWGDGGGRGRAAAAATTTTAAAAAAATAAGGGGGGRGGGGDAGQGTMPKD